MAVPLVEVTRGGVVEKVHRGHVVVVNREREVVASLGDPYMETYMRSCAKPVQALPLVVSGGADVYDISPKELAIMCASHYGEAFHIEVIDGILAKLGLSEANLSCGAAVSIKMAVALEQARKGIVLDQRYNDCSGKHCGMLTLCLHRDYPLEGYIEPEHPVQREILETFAAFCEVAVGDIGIGIDGCSVPVFYLPLFNMALSYVKLTNPESFDTRFEKACRRIVDAMTGCPEMVSGSGGFCTELMRHTGGKLIGKVGANGVYCVGSKENGLGLAVKIEDGSMEVLSTVALQVLLDLDLLTPREYGQLKDFHIRGITNDRNIVVGVQRPCFKTF